MDEVHGGHDAIREAPDRGTLQYIVAGAGGYCGYSALHQLKDPDQVDLPSDVQIVKSNTDLPGFMKITVTDAEIQCSYYTVSRAAKPQDTKATEFESFTVHL